MSSNLVAPVISCKRDIRESLSILTPALLELLVVCWTFVKGEPVFVVVANCVIFFIASRLLAIFVANARRYFV